MQIGDKLRALRLENRTTLVELSRKAGVSKSLLSRIERGHSVPTLTTLEKITAALGVDLGRFFSNHQAEDLDSSSERSALHMVPGNQSLDAVPMVNENGSKIISVTHQDQRRKLIMPWGGYYEMLCPDMQHKIEFIFINYPVGKRATELYSHEGEECGIILQGKFRGIIGDREFVLEAGDSIYYASSIPHRWENAGDVEAKAIWAITPPSF
jgi:transcriptional regulator with XRE-family HTH domain